MLAWCAVMRDELPMAKAQVDVEVERRGSVSGTLVVKSLMVEIKLVVDREKEVPTNVHFCGLWRAPGKVYCDLVDVEDELLSCEREANELAIAE
jgi:hypothetical protein